MSLPDRVAQLNQFVDLFFDTQNDSDRLKQAWRDSRVQAEAAMLLSFWQTAEHCTTLKIGVDVNDTTVQWHALPSSKAALQLGGSAGDADTYVLRLGLPHAVARIERGKHGTYWLHAQVAAEVWMATGYRVPLFDQPQTCGSGVIVQTGSIFRTGEHVFQVLVAPAVRKGNIFGVAPTCVDLPPPVAVPVQQDLESSEAARCTIKCVAPLTSPLLNRVWSMQYGKGGSSFPIGTSATAMVTLPLTDLLASPVHCVLYSTYGYFWLLDNNSGFGTYYELFPSAKPRKVAPSTTPLHLLLGDTLSLTQATVMVV